MSYLGVVLYPVLGGVRDIASAITPYEQTQSNRVCCSQTLDAVFPKDLFFRLFQRGKVVFRKFTNEFK